MSTTSKLGADMLNDEQIAAFEGLPIEQAKFYFDRRNADGRTHREMVDALLARQPAAIGKEATWAPERIWLQRGIGEEGSHTWCEHQIGEDSIGEAIEEAEYVRVDAAPLANEASKPAPSVEQDERERFDKALMAYAMEFSESIDAEKIRVAHKRVMDLFESRAASTSANVARLLIDDLQGKALEHGFKYWRAPDAHGITGTAEQAENLIADLVGVEVEVTSHISPFADVAQGARPVPRDFFVPGQMARPFKAPDAGEHDPWYVALPNGNLIKLGFHADDSVDRAQAEFIADAINAALTASPAFALRALYTYADSANVAQGANLDVCYGPMPESNGKTNWTAILHKGDLAEGHTIDRSEYPDRVRYAADCVRYLIGELKERPWILDYDADKHSGYVANVAQGAEAFQSRVQPWMLECFGPEIAADKIERNHRFFEEATEAVQANGMTRSEAHQLVDYTFDRPLGELHQEIGGVMVTLAALCLASGQDMHAAGETELARIWTKVQAIRAKQAAKPKHSPLPAPPTQTALTDDARDVKLEALNILHELSAVKRYSLQHHSASKGRTSSTLNVPNELLARIDALTAGDTK